jgi:iron complex transport system ATP-binding protein
MDIADFAERPVAELSGGERARVLVARALAQEAAVLVADEPTAGLDPAHALALFGHFRRLAAEGRAVVVALHDLSLAARFADRVLLLRDGRALAEGAPRAVLTPDVLAATYGIRATLAEIEGLPVVLPVEPLP